MKMKDYADIKRQVKKSDKQIENSVHVRKEATDKGSPAWVTAMAHTAQERFAYHRKESRW